MSEDRVRLTDQGRAKIEGSVKGTVSSLKPVDDYVVNEEGGSDWLPLPAREAMQPLRHDWVMQQSLRPYTPVLLGMARPLSEEEQAQRLLLLFHPWTLDEENSTQTLPFNWSSPTREPSAELRENSDNEDLQDTVVTFNADELKQAMKTHVRGGGEAEWHMERGHQAVPDDDRDV
eukprot:6486781-Amphidinium_carterae.2